MTDRGSDQGAQDSEAHEEPASETASGAGGGEEADAETSSPSKPDEEEGDTVEPAEAPAPGVPVSPAELSRMKAEAAQAKGVSQPEEASNGGE